MIRNPVYLGEASSGKHVNPDAHEPLVTRAEWEAARRTAAQSRAPGKATGCFVRTGPLRRLPLRHEARHDAWPRRIKARDLPLPRSSCRRQMPCSAPRLWPACSIPTRECPRTRSARTGPSRRRRKRRRPSTPRLCESRTEPRTGRLPRGRPGQRRWAGAVSRSASRTSTGARRRPPRTRRSTTSRLAPCVDLTPGTCAKHGQLSLSPRKASTRRLHRRDRLCAVRAPAALSRSGASPRPLARAGAG